MWSSSIATGSWNRFGAGGMREVWRAIHLLLDLAVALKRSCLGATNDQQTEDKQKRALREARIAARLRHHRHVVTTYDVRVEDGDVWLVLEYVPSRSLARILREHGPVSPGYAARIGAQVADAPAAAHVVGVEHRDIIPGSVLIDDKGTVTVIDFGNARWHGYPRLTRPVQITATYAYLAPEVARSAEFSRFTPLLLELLAPTAAARPAAATARALLDQFRPEKTALPPASPKQRAQRRTTPG